MSSSRYFAVIAIASVLIFGIFSVSLETRNAHAQAGTWYLGKGVQQDMFITYNIRELDTNDRIPFQITIYFQEQDDRGAWVAPTFVATQGRVMEGTLRLADNNLTPLGGSEIPSEMLPFIAGYQNSLTFLEAYASKAGPRSLSGTDWGNVAGTGASIIGPRGTETVTVEGGTFETTIIGYERGNVQNRMWVSENFPYPVKALVYADVTEPPAPLRYEYELVAYGDGQPEAPEDIREAPLPPLTRGTITLEHQVQLDWHPAEILPGQETRFTITFFDNRGNQVENVGYDFTIRDADRNAITHVENRLSRTGVAEHDVTFEEGGSVTIEVVVNSVGGAVSYGGFREMAEFNIVVIPEFPVSAVIITAAVIGFVVLMTRFQGTSFMGRFSGRNTL